VFFLVGLAKDLCAPTSTQTHRIVQVIFAVMYSFLLANVQVSLRVLYRFICGFVLVMDDNEQ